MFDHDVLAIIFLLLLGVAVLAYAILDGYDLGVGILLPLKAEKEKERDTYISSIGPFWDANETWLVLAVGILLIAFPAAHNIILHQLYIPVLFMLCGLILRGVSFDFRAKARVSHKTTWDKLFKLGSIMASVAQGYMLGRYVLGFENSTAAYAFAVLSSLCVTAAYAYIGGAWLVMKTEGGMQKKIAGTTRRAGWLAALGIFAVCLINPLTSDYVWLRWFSLPEAFLLFPIPLTCFAMFILADRFLRKIPLANDFGCWIPFVAALTIFFLCFQGLAYSFYPYVVPGEMTVFEAVAAPESLQFVLIGALIVVPMILIYTAFSYRVFWGKTTELNYY